MRTLPLHNNPVLLIHDAMVMHMAELLLLTVLHNFDDLYLGVVWSFGTHRTVQVQEIEVYK